MAARSDLPFWADQYVKHIRQHRPKMYKELKDAGELEALALSIQNSAEDCYNRLVQSYKASGDSESTAEMYAESDVMRQYILLPTEQDVPILGENMDEMAEEPEDAFEPGHLEFLKFMSESISTTYL
jgi:Transposon-encoded protein TnpV